MRRFLADVHMHADFDPVKRKWHGEQPQHLAKRIVFGTPLDLIALSEHNKVSDQFFELQDRMHEEQENYRRSKGSERNIETLLGMELAVMFQQRRYHIGYVFEGKFQRAATLPDVPATRSEIHSKEFEDYRLDYPGVAILNHPTWKDATDRELAITREFMKSGLVDGAEVINGSMVFHKNGHSKASYDTARMFVDVRLEQEQAKRRTSKEDVPSHNGNGNGLPRIAAIGGSDAHEARAVGYAATTYMGDGPLAYFDAVRRGITSVVPLEMDRVVPSVEKMCHDVKHLARFLMFPKPNGIDYLRKKKQWKRERKKQWYN